MSNRYNTTVTIAVAGALSFVIMIFEFALPVFPPFLRLDFSDIPALLVGFSLGPGPGLMVVAIRNFLHLAISATMGVGELANFIISGSLVLSASYLYLRWQRAVPGLIVGSLVMVFMAVMTNLYLIIPLYERVLNLPLEEILTAAREVNPHVESPATYLIFVIVPFNLLKATAVSLLFLPVYRRIKESKTYKSMQRS